MADNCNNLSITAVGGLDVIRNHIIVNKLYDSSFQAIQNILDHFNLRDEFFGTVIGIVYDVRNNDGEDEENDIQLFDYVPQLPPERGGGRGGRRGGRRGRGTGRAPGRPPKRLNEIRKPLEIMPQLSPERGGGRGGRRARGSGRGPGRPPTRLSEIRKSLEIMPQLPSERGRGPG